MVNTEPNIELRNAMVKTGKSFIELSRFIGVSDKTLTRAMNGKAIKPINARSILDALRLYSVPTNGITISTMEQGRKKKI